jgi:hypothetical protein
MKREASPAVTADRPPQDKHNEASPSTTDASHPSKRLKMESGNGDHSNGSADAKPKPAERQDNRATGEAMVKAE